MSKTNKENRNIDDELERDTPESSSVADRNRSIPYGRQNITQEDIDAVVEVLKSDYLTQGPRIAEFEKAFASYVGSNYAVAVSNGTAALHLSALALNVKPGDKVITTPITFAASANCVRYCGGEVVFADIHPQTYLLDIQEVRKLLEVAPSGTYQGIVAVDFAGRAVDLKAFRKLADEYNLWILEDSCHAPGGYFIDNDGVKQHCGNGKFADLAIFSFHPVKHIATGEGGMITTNDLELYNKLNTLRTHGIVKDEQSYLNDPEWARGHNVNNVADNHGLAETNAGEENIKWPQWYMEMQILGYNYRLSDMQAALGNSQLRRAERGIRRRRQMALKYFRAFKDVPQITDYNFDNLEDRLAEKAENIDENCGHAFHLYVVEAEDRLGLYNYLRQHKIYAQIHYIPLHLMPYYRKLANDKPPFLMHAEGYYNHCISLPMFPTLTDEDQEYVISTLKRYYDE